MVTIFTAHMYVRRMKDGIDVVPVLSGLRFLNMNYILPCSTVTACMAAHSCT